MFWVSETRLRADHSRVVLPDSQNGAFEPRKMTLRRLFSSSLILSMSLATLGYIFTAKWRKTLQTFSGPHHDDKHSPFLQSTSRRTTQWIKSSNETDEIVVPQVNVSITDHSAVKRWRKSTSFAAYARANETNNMRDLAMPLLNEEFLRQIVEEWTRPLPEDYLRRPLVLVGPSGVGKNRLISSLLRDYSKFFERVVTHTTRKPRPNEINGTHYHFVSQEIFDKLNLSDTRYFVETAKVHNNSYGMSFFAWDTIYRKGKICIMEVDIQGAMSLRAIQRSLHLHPNYIFVAPPSIEKLLERLLLRGTESKEQIQLRLQNAVKEIEIMQQMSFFRAKLVNSDIYTTSDKLFRCVRDW